jgi:hypothetical protein
LFAAFERRPSRLEHPVRAPNQQTPAASAAGARCAGRFGHRLRTRHAGMRLLSCTSASYGARVVSMATSRRRRDIKPGRAKGFGPRFRSVRCRGRVLGWRHGSALEREVRAAYGSRRQSGARSPWVFGSTASGGFVAMATSSRLRRTRSRAAAQARSRGSPQGFARAVDHEPRVSSDVSQPYGGDTVFEDVQAPDEGFSRGLVSKVSASFGSCRPPPRWSLLRRGGTGTSWQRGSETATKRGSVELVESAATSARSVRRIG